MGILDEAIREHLELKRQHGAGDDELKQLEDDAFGSPGRPGDAAPDPVAEAATEFMAQPDLGEAQPDLGEAGAEVEPDVPAAPARREPAAGLVDLQEAPEAPSEESEEEPAAEEQSATEHEAVPAPPAGPNTEERHAIADQPTEMFDVEEEFGGADAAAGPVEEPAPGDEDLVAEEISEPRLGPSQPIHDLEPAAADVVEDEEDEVLEEDDDFWSEQRLSDELDQALESPVADEQEPAAVEEESAVVEESDEPEGDDDHDALEETPDFLEQAPEDDQLWFEQKPPKDFDFDD